MGSTGLVGSFESSTVVFAGGQCEATKMYAETTSTRMWDISQDCMMQRKTCLRLVGKMAPKGIANKETEERMHR